MEKTKKYCHICEAVKQQVQNAEDALINSRSLDLQNLKSTLETANWLLNYYRNYNQSLDYVSLVSKIETVQVHRSQNASKNMVVKLTNKFENGTVFVMGNYSSPNTHQ